MAVRTAPEPRGGVVPVQKPPRGARVVGNTPSGDVIWEKEVTRLARDENDRPIKDPLVDESTGEEVWKKHPTTGEKLYPRVKARMETVTERFTLHIERNERGYATGTITKNRNFAADADEMRRVETREQAQRLEQDFFAKAAEAGISADALLATLKEQSTPEDAEEADEEVEYPHMYGPGLWRLSNGDTFRGKKVEAVAAEAEIG